MCTPFSSSDLISPALQETHMSEKGSVHAIPLNLQAIKTASVKCLFR